MKADELSSLIAAIHRTNQLGYPIAILAAGLPKIVGMLSKIKSYSERLFVYREIGALTEAQAKDAILNPAVKSGIKYDNEAVEKNC